MKLIGVRPLSQHYLSLYSDEVRRIRKKTKPGLLPPFYADMPSSLEEIMESEKRYCEAYLKNPITTDVKYFFKILNSIIFKGKRSA
jgi:lipopolysaccharide/colanic/teichoic acid biosynthesis glycosyltransferase